MMHVPPSPPPLRVPQNTPITTGTPNSPTPTPSTKTTPLPLSSLLNILLPHTPPLVFPPLQPLNPSLTPIISALVLHPALEAALHLLNGDLASAHLLVRHMVGPPAVEGMLLHSIFRRIEGDFDNARAWGSDVGDCCSGWEAKRKGEERLGEDVLREIEGVGVGGSSLVEWVYEGDEGQAEMIELVERVRGGETGEEKRAEDMARRELERVVDWCRRKFGEGVWKDARRAWVRPNEDLRGIGKDVVMGEGGWRHF